MTNLMYCATCAEPAEAARLRAVASGSEARRWTLRAAIQLVVQQVIQWSTLLLLLSLIVIAIRTQLRLRPSDSDGHIPLAISLVTLFIGHTSSCTSNNSSWFYCSCSLTGKLYLLSLTLFVS